MKKHLFLKSLLVLIGVLITSLTTNVWAWTAVYLNGNFTENNWDQNTYHINYELDGLNSGHFFYPFYSTTGDKYWRLRQNGDRLSPSTANFVQNVGTAGYKVGKNGEKNFKSTTIKNGVTAVHINQKSGGDQSPYVWLERPTIYIWHNWNNNTGSWNNNGGSGQKAMTDNQDGTYTYDGLFAGTGADQNKTNVGIEGSAAVKKYFGPSDVTVNGSPTTGDKCRFTWNSSGYKGYDGETSNRGSLTITKYYTITFDKNGSEADDSDVTGSLPENQDALYNTATTLAGSANLKRTGYRFDGWNSQANGLGTDYGVNGSITITANTTLYAKWVAADTWYLKGGKTDGTGDDGMGNWNESNMFVYSTANSMSVSVNLTAGQTYQFKLYNSAGASDYDKWYGNGTESDGKSKIIGTLDAENINDGYWTFEKGHKNCALTATATGTYVFTIDASTDNYPRLRVYFPGDAPKVFLQKNKYIYLDGTAGVWKNDTYKARFWFKATTTNVHTSNIECLHDNDLDEDYMYYTRVPDNDYVDRVQINRINSSSGNADYFSKVKHGYTRTDANQNCLVLDASGNWGTGGSDLANLSWGTYCPPMSNATLYAVNSDEKTIIYGGDGEEDTPYLVATGANIYVSASSESVLDDDNMTPHYLFYKDDTPENAYGYYSASNEHIYTASGTTGTKQEMTVYAKNFYNETYGTASPVSNSIFYEARTAYAVSIYPTNVTKFSGRTGTKGAVVDVDYIATFAADEGYDLPASTAGGKVIVECVTTDITANCTWSVSDGVGTLTIPAAQVTGDLYITVTGVLKTYDITYSGGTYGSGSLTGGTKNHFTDYTLSDNSTAFTRDSYTYDGWSINADGSTKDYNLGGTYSTEADQTFYPHWIPAYSVTHTLSHINCTSGATGSIAGVSGRNYVATFTAPAGYALPETVGVTIGGVSKTQGTHFTWSISDGVGTLTVLSVNVTAAIVVTLTGTPVTLRFTSGSDWHTASYWTPACVPTIEHDVIIPKTCWISHPNAQAKSVTIEHYGEKEGKLYINSMALYTGALLIAEGITAIHEEDGDPDPTTKNDLQIVTDYYGNGGLICGNASANTEAQYIFYSKVYRYGSYYINQYVGIPFVNMDPYDWYGVSIFEYNPAKDQWMTPVLDEGKLKRFTAYNIISKMSGVGYTNFYTDGILNLPGTVPDPDNNRLKVLECGWRNEGDFDEGKFPASIDETEGHQDYMFANSWTAPISVADMSEEDFDNVSQVLYVFNAGWSNPDADAKKEVGDLAGQWTQFPIAAAKAGELAYPAFIPATQAFLVTATAANATLTLDYKKHVFDPAKNAGTINTSPTRAPRYKKSESPISKLIMTVSSDTTIADILHLFEREDFTPSYDDGWEGYKIFGRKSAPQLYALQGESKMSIEATPEMHGTLLGFKAGTDTNAYVLSFEYNDEEPLYLYDRETAEFTQITNDATYSFTTNDTEEHQRFIISRVNSPSILTSLEEIANESVKHAEKYFENNMLFIRRGERVYDARGNRVK